MKFNKNRTRTFMPARATAERVLVFWFPGDDRLKQHLGENVLLHNPHCGVGLWVLRDGTFTGMSGYPVDEWEKRRHELTPAGYVTV